MDYLNFIFIQSRLINNLFISIMHHYLNTTRDILAQSGLEKEFLHADVTH